MKEITNMPTRDKELQDLLVDDWEQVCMCMTSLPAETVNKLSALIDRIIDRNIELAKYQ